MEGNSSSNSQAKSTLGTIVSAFLSSDSSVKADSWQSYVDGMLKIDVYFAEKKPRYKEEKKVENYTVKGEKNYQAVKETFLKRDDFKGKTIQDLRCAVAKGVNSSQLKPGDKCTMSWKEITEGGFEYKKLNKVRFGKKTLIVGEWLSKEMKLREGTLKLELYEDQRDNDTKVFDGPLKIMIDGVENTKLELAFSENNNEDNKKFEKEITISPKSDSELQSLVKKIGERKDKNAFIYVRAKFLGWLPGGWGLEANYLKEGHPFKVYVRDVCPIDKRYQSHFVIHSTAYEVPESKILSWKNSKVTGQGHKYVMRDGKVIEVWPFSAKNVFATKAEHKAGKVSKGQMFHVELNYKELVLPTEAQYQALADLYLEAADVHDYWPIIVPHIEVDRGIPDGHRDPSDFDYNRFYDILKKRNVPIDDIPHFEHERYWGEAAPGSEPLYWDPQASDNFSWPPVLKRKPNPPKLGNTKETRLQRIQRWERASAMKEQEKK